MKTSVLYIAIFYAHGKLGITYLIDTNYFIDYGTHLLSNALQEGINTFNNVMSNGSNINVPKFKGAFDILKPTFLDLSKTTLDITGTWEKVTKSPMPFIYPGPNLHIYKAFIGLCLGIFTIIVNNGLGFSDKFFDILENLQNKTLGKIKSVTKNSLNTVWNQQYMDCIVRNFQRNFSVYPFSNSNQTNNIVSLAGVAIYLN